MNQVTVPSDKSTATVVIALRLGLATVFLVFGIWKALAPVDWVIFMPNWVAGAVAGIDSIDALGVLKMMGFVEAVLGLQLLVGFFTKVSAAICTLLLAGIVFHVGFDQVGIRDLGLLAAALALAFAGSGPWSVDHWLDHAVITSEE